MGILVIAFFRIFQILMNSVAIVAVIDVIKIYFKGF